MIRNYKQYSKLRFSKLAQAALLRVCVQVLHFVFYQMENDSKSNIFHHRLEVLVLRY